MVPWISPSETETFLKLLKFVRYILTSFVSRQMVDIRLLSLPWLRATIKIWPKMPHTKNKFFTPKLKITVVRKLEWVGSCNTCNTKNLFYCSKVFMPFFFKESSGLKENMVSTIGSVKLRNEKFAINLNWNINIDHLH